MEKKIFYDVLESNDLKVVAEAVKQQNNDILKTDETIKACDEVIEANEDEIEVLVATMTKQRVSKYLKYNEYVLDRLTQKMSQLMGLETSDPDYWTEWVKEQKKKDKAKAKERKGKKGE